MRISLFFFSFFFVGRLIAQTNVYHPFPDSNAHWSEHAWWVSGNNGVHDNYTLFIDGDTIIGFKSYHKIYKSGYLQASGSPVYYFNEYKGGLRQNTAQKKVYFSPANSPPGEALLYDFNLNIGDTLPNTYNGGNANFVFGIDSVLVGTSYHKRFLLKPLSGFMPPPPSDTNISIIEGIGSTFGLYNSMTFYSEAGGVLECFKKDIGAYPDTIACSFATLVSEPQSLKSALEISPNPSSGVVFIRSTKELQYSVCDVFGREVFQSTEASESITLDLSFYPKGIYFVRGKSGVKVFSRKIILQ